MKQKTDRLAIARQNYQNARDALEAGAPGAEARLERARRELRQAESEHDGAVLADRLRSWRA